MPARLSTVFRSDNNPKRSKNLDSTSPSTNNTDMDTTSENIFRSGYIALIGRPNVGKSTLLNAILKHNIAAISPRPQTTRRNQLGILTRTDAQLIFIDTPGIHQAMHKLGERMNASAREAVQDADLHLVLFDASVPPTAEDYAVAQILRDAYDPPPRLAVLNKIDLLKADAYPRRLEQYQSLLPETSFLSVSALKGLPEDFIQLLISNLPEGPQYFDEDVITQDFERDIAAELIRSAGMHYLEKEVPHCIAVRMDEYIERGDHGALIQATIFVERSSQKGIVIGKGGSMIRKIGSHARKEIEAMSGRKVFLELRVKVLQGWRNDAQNLKKLGFGVAEKP